MPKTKIYLDILDKFSMYFHKELNSRDASEVRKYIKKRNINSEYVKKYRLGYCPKVYSKIYNFMTYHGISKDDVEHLGVFCRDKKDKEKIIFLFSKRLIFPIFNPYDEVIGFSSRDITGKAQSKYINSPVSEIYQKRRTLYGLNFCKRILFNKKSAILVEGNIDIIKCQQTGLKNVVGQLGTAFTEEQAKVLKRYVDQVIIIFDSDEAGIKAANKTKCILKSNGIKSKRIFLPDGYDPDSFIDEFGIKEFKNYIIGVK